MTTVTLAQPLPAGWVKAPSRLVFSLPGELLGTYLRIRHHDRGQGCWATLETLGAGLVSERQLRRHLRELERLGLIQVAGRSNYGTLVLRCVEAADEAPADAPPATGVRPPRTWVSAPPGHERPVKQIPLRENDPLKNNQQPAPIAADQEADPAVVVSKAAPQETTTQQGQAPPASGDMLALHLPDDLTALAARRKGLSAATIRRLVGLAGAEAVRAAATVLVEQYPDDGRVKSFGALLTRAVQQGWTHPEAAARAARTARVAELTAAAPPPGTRWAVAADGRRVGVIEVTADVVRTDAGCVIPREQWPTWTWLAEALDAPQAAACPVGEAPAPTDDRRCRLALVAASLRIRRPSPERLQALLDRHGLTHEELDAYLAETAQ